MALPSYSISQPPATRRGFTLLEVLVVLAIVGVIVSLTLFFTPQHYGRAALETERQALLLALQQARHQAQMNVAGEPHGVAIAPAGYAGYVIFVGDSFEVSDVEQQTRVPLPPSISISTPATEIIFKPLSGESTADAVVTLQSKATGGVGSINVLTNGYVGW